MGHDDRCARTKYYGRRHVTDPQTPRSETTYITGASGNTDNQSSRYVPSKYTAVNSTGNYGQAYVDIAITPDDIRVATRGLQNASVLTTEG